MRKAPAITGPRTAALAPSTASLPPFLRRLVLGRRRRGLRRGEGCGGDGGEGLRRARRGRFLLKSSVEVRRREGRHVSGERLGRT